MKNSIRYILLTIFVLLLASCTIDYVEPVQSGLPQASSLTPVITVDQETNYVTFSITDKEVVPLWIFGSERIDKDVNKKFAYAQNGITLRIRDAGVHTVELKAYNANGISQGSQILTYELENTYRDPFNPTPYMKAIANAWVWDKETPGHFGCGETAENPTGWWSCGANEKEDMGLYDDIMTFTADGQYTYDPGSGGTVYVNWGSDFLADGHADEIAAKTDYQAEIAAYTHPYTIENNWNEAGIEEIVLVLQEGDNLSYVPNKEAYTTNTRYQFVSTKTSDIRKNLKLVNYSPTANNGGSIAWLYSFVPYVQGVTPQDLLAGTDPAGKVWVMDADTKGHLGCGPDAGNPAGWWSANPYEKEGFGMYDNELTFKPDGTYAFNPGADGLIYVNKDVTALGGPAGEDFTLAWESQEVTYTFDGETITLPKGATVGYIPNDGTYNNPVFIVTNLTESSLTLVASIEGISWQFIFRARDYVAPESSFGGVAFESGKANVHLEQGNTYPVTGIDLTQIWIDPDFFELVDNTSLRFLAVTGDYQIMNKTTWLKALPMSGGEYATYEDGGLWIIGTGIHKPKTEPEPGWTTDASVDIPFAKTGDNTYQLTAYITGPNFKIFGQPNWGKEYGGQDFGTLQLNDYFTINGYPNGSDSDNGNIWSGSAFAEGWYVFKLTENSGKFDLTVDRWMKETVVYDITGAGNLWRNAVITPEYWYSPENWTGGISPLAQITENNGFTAEIPEGVGGSEWQAQNKLHSGIATSSEKKYDFCCTLTATEDMTITVKMTGNPEGAEEVNAFFYNGGVALSADEPLIFKMPGISQKEGNPDLTLIFDLGRSPVGSKLTVTDICFQEHNAVVVPVE